MSAAEEIRDDSEITQDVAPTETVVVIPTGPTPPATNFEQMIGRGKRSSASEATEAERADESRKAAPKARAKPGKPDRPKAPPKPGKPDKPVKAAVPKVGPDDDPAKVLLPQGKPKVETVKIADLELDLAFQSRVKTDPRTVAEYAESLEEGDEFPPIPVYRDPESKKLYPYGGWHRISAFKSQSRLEIPAAILPGTREQAILASLRENIEHDKSGLRRSREDKQRLIGAALANPVLSRLSLRKIALFVGVKHPTVASFKKRVEAAERGEPVQPDLSKAAVSPEAPAAPASSGSPVVEPEKAPLPAAVAVKDTETDEQFLSRCGARRHLAGQQLAVFDDQALFWRFLNDLPEFEAFVGKVMPGINKARVLGPLRVRVREVAKFPSPVDWKACGDCDGKGNVKGAVCRSCKGDGFHVQGK